MQDFISAVKSNDLVKAKKAVSSIMSERLVGLVESRKIEIARSILIEGEEPEKDENEDKGESENKDKPEKDEPEKDEGDKSGKDKKDKDE